MRWLFSFLFLLCIVSCNGRYITPDPDFGIYDRIKVPLTVQPEYPRLWQEVQQCSGLQKKWGGIKFYVIDMDVVGLPAHDIWFAAYWNQPDNSITFLQRYVHDERTIKHEMLHSLIGHSGHPDSLFITKCNVR